MALAVPGIGLMRRAAVDVADGSGGGKAEKTEYWGFVEVLSSTHKEKERKIQQKKKKKTSRGSSTHPHPHIHSRTEDRGTYRWGAVDDALLAEELALNLLVDTREVHNVVLHGHHLICQSKEEVRSVYGSRRGGDGKKKKKKDEEETIQQARRRRASVR